MEPLALVGCSDDAIQVLGEVSNESFHDCIGEGQLQLDINIATSSVSMRYEPNGKDELRRNLEQVKENEAEEARVRVLSRCKALTFHVVD
eukprot:scaffold553197_cov114-Attheya_sp.AAC.1